MRRLNAKGRGILLMHDIHPATAMALPTLLKELKANGYHVVQVVASGERPKSVPVLVASPAEDKGNWPRVLKTSATGSASDASALRHRVKKTLASDEKPRCAIASRRPMPAMGRRSVTASRPPAPAKSRSYATASRRRWPASAVRRRSRTCRHPIVPQASAGS